MKTDAGRKIAGKNVANKRIIRTLTWRTIREKKWKNLIAVLAIALTSVLFTALFTVGGSMLTTFEESTFRQIGTSAHGGYKYLSMEEYEKIKAAAIRLLLMISWQASAQALS